MVVDNLMRRCLARIWLFIVLRKDFSHGLYGTQTHRFHTLQPLGKTSLSCSTFGYNIIYTIQSASIVVLLRDDVYCSTVVSSCVHVTLVLSLWPPQAIFTLDCMLCAVYPHSFANERCFLPIL